jgi:ATP-dependent exoDNAse (exonuclease V) alpha subunit
LQRLWRERLSERELAAIEAVRANATHPVQVEPQHATAMDYALAHVLERKSVAGEREVAREALKFGLGRGVTPEGIWKEMGRAGIIRRDGMVSTQTVLGEEKRIVEFAVKGRGACRPLRQNALPSVAEVDRGRSDRPQEPPRPAAGGESRAYVLETAGGYRQTMRDQRSATQPDIATLSPSQQAAIRHVWNSPDRIMVIEGKAGVGKTTLLKPLLSGINVPWLAVATSSDASRINLREDPFFAEADTLSAFFKSEELHERVRGGLLVLDEASMTSAPDFAKLTKLADQLNFRILAVGDPGQHKSVGRGHIMDLLTKKANLPVALVDDIQRQKRAERKEYLTAAELLSKGRTADAFAVLDGIGWVKDANLATLADDYLAVQKSGKRPIVICPTHAERKHVEVALRERLRKEGLLKGIEQEVSSLTNLHMTEAELAEARKEKPEGVVFGRFGAYHPEAMKLAVGDRVRITAGGKDMSGGRLDNGMVFTVTGFTKAGDVRVRNDDSRLERTIRRDYGHWRLGYVETSPGSQGKTRDVPLVWEPVSTFPAITSAAAYVPVTRGTQKVFVYTDDKAGLQEVWQREETHLHASDLVKRPRHKLRQRLKRHISFLRDIASRATDRLLTLATPTQENHREFSLSR